LFPSSVARGQTGAASSLTSSSSWPPDTAPSVFESESRPSKVARHEQSADVHSVSSSAGKENADPAIHALAEAARKATSTLAQFCADRRARDAKEQLEASEEARLQLTLSGIDQMVRIRSPLIWSFSLCSAAWFVPTLPWAALGRSAELPRLSLVNLKSSLAASVLARRARQPGMGRMTEKTHKAKSDYFCHHVSCGKIFFGFESCLSPQMWPWTMCPCIS